ncbi:MAG: hypothetical protein QF464_15090, partial [Myxococcota bacterium]|nr:hypothetical protein [Myxococcota bacterium]
MSLLARPRTLLFGLTFAIAGCGSATIDDGGLVVDAGQTDGAAAPGPDAPVWSPQGDGSGGADAEGGSPDFGAPCTENADCTSGYCIEGPEGDVCTKTCSEVCPDGYQCKGVQGVGPDTVFICVPILTELCGPCQDDVQCVEGVCAQVDGSGHCVTGCSGGDDCPAAYVCEVDADGAGWCVPATGSCTCYSELNGGQRPCWTSTGAGECFGIESCNPAVGWEGCTAAEPSAETCDYLDDDCDGTVDEEFKNEEGVYDGYLNCGACNVSCAFGFPNSAATECDTTGTQPQCQVVACLPGYVKLNAYQCVPEGASLCQPCDADEACLGEGAACLSSAEGSFCGQACGGPGDCPTGYGCELADGAALYQCVPLTGSCTCNELNIGLSRACVETWTPAAPDEVAYACPGAETCTDAGWGVCVLPSEDCDGVDDDCDGDVDEDYRDESGLYAGVEHCGGCGVSCLALVDTEAHATAICDVSAGFPFCTYGCVDGYVDVDGISDNGCECWPAAGQDIP